MKRTGLDVANSNKAVTGVTAARTRSKLVLEVDQQKTKPMNRYFFISNHRVLCFLYSLLFLPLFMFVSNEQFRVCENTDILSLW